MVVSTASSIEKELEDQVLERTSLTTLAEDRQQRIQILESLLKREKVTCTELQQSLNKANEDVHRGKKKR